MRAFLRHRRFTYTLVLAAFVGRALVPIGFMPAAFDAGGPIILCPGGSAGPLVHFLAARTADHSSAHVQHQHPPDSPEAWELCPVGASLGAAAPAVAVEFQLPALEHALEALEPTQIVDRVVPRRYQARAPPLV